MRVERYGAIFFTAMITFLVIIAAQGADALKKNSDLNHTKPDETTPVAGPDIPAQPTLEEKLQSMVVAGQAEWNGQKLPPYEPKAVNKGDRLISDLVIEDRE